MASQNHRKNGVALISAIRLALVSCSGVYLDKVHQYFRDYQPLQAHQHLQQWNLFGVSWLGSSDPLETLGAITLLEMGYPRDTVRNSILILHRQREPAVEITALEVLDFIWKEEDIERQRQEEEASCPRHPGDAQPPALPTGMEHLNLGGSPAVTQGSISALGTSCTTSVSTLTSASGATQSTNATSQGQGKDEGKGQNTTVGGNGNTRGRSMQRDEFEELQEENKRLKEQITCKICMENQISVVFLPCGHFVCCEVCAPAFQRCLICDRHIQQSIRPSVNP